MSTLLKQLLTYVGICLAMSCNMVAASVVKKPLAHHRKHGTVSPIIVPTVVHTDAYCLAETMYYEARNQPIQGRIAVAYVVLNRARESHLTPCTIISQKNQFSWYRDTALRSRKKETEAWNAAKLLASDIMSSPERFVDPTNGATFFSTKGVYPIKRTKLSIAIAIQDHVFYRLKTTPDVLRTTYTKASQNMRSPISIPAVYTQ